MFLVGVAGPHLTVSGAIFTDKFISQRFADYIFLGPLPAFKGRFALDHSIRRVAQVLRALTQATNELSHCYSTLEFKSSSTHKPHSRQRASPHCGGPRPQLVPLHPVPRSVVPPFFSMFTVGDTEYTVDYKSCLAPSSSSSAVFEGIITCDGDQEKHNVVVKFAATHCADAHEKLAKKGRAPHLWFCEQVESVGMYVVIMGHEDGVCADQLLTKKEHIEQLQEAVRLLHE